MKLDRHYQDKACRLINEIGWNPLEKPVQWWVWKDFVVLRRIWNQTVEG